MKFEYEGIFEEVLDELELYGKYKANFDSHFMDEVKNNEDGKLVLVTAILYPPTRKKEFRPHSSDSGSLYLLSVDY